MSDTIILAIIAFLGVLSNNLFNYLIYRKTEHGISLSEKNHILGTGIETQLIQVKKEIDGKMDTLLEVSNKAAKAEGVLEGKSNGK